MNTRATHTFVSVLLGLMATSAVADEPQTVTLRGESFDVWPVENLRARGLDVREVPREKNAAWIYIDAINAYVDLPKELSKAFEYAFDATWPDDQTALADYLKHPDNRRAIEFVTNAAAMTDCQVPYFGDPRESVIGVLLPNLSHYRFLAKLMVADGRRLVAEGQIDQASKTFLSVMGMGEHIAQGHTLIEGLVGVAVWELSDRAMVDMIFHERLSAHQLQSLQAELARRANRVPTTQQGLQGERQFGPAIVDELVSRPLRAFQNFRSMLGLTGNEFGNYAPAKPITVPQDGWGRLEVRIGQLIFPDRAIKRHMAGFYDLVADRFGAGAYGPAMTGVDEERYIQNEIPQWDVVSRVMLPSLSRAALLGRRCELVYAATQTIIGIRRYMLRNDNRPPAHLNELGDLVPDGATIDPFNGDPLIYQLTPEGWLLYSVGANFVDDGGRQGERWDELDLVYRFPPAPVKPFDAPPPAREESTDG